MKRHDCTCFAVLMTCRILDTSRYSSKVIEAKQPMATSIRKLCEELLLEKKMKKGWSRERILDLAMTVLFFQLFECLVLILASFFWYCKAIDLASKNL